MFHLYLLSMRHMSAHDEAMIFYGHQINNKRTLAEQLKAEALELMRKRKSRISQELDTSSTDDAYNVALEGYKMSSMEQCMQEFQIREQELLKTRSKMRGFPLKITSGYSERLPETLIETLNWWLSHFSTNNENNSN